MRKPIETTTSLLLMVLVMAGVGALMPVDARAQSSSYDPVQSIYRNGVPHVDKRGRTRLAYDPAQSFFTIGAWGVPLHGEDSGYFYDWQELKDANFNTVWPWYRSTSASLADGADHDMQVVIMGAQDNATLQQYKDHPNLLGNQWYDEPMVGIFPQGESYNLQKYNEYQQYIQNAHSIAPDMPVFINDAPAIWPNEPNYPNNRREWWLNWHTAGDLGSQDVYPIFPYTRSVGRDAYGIQVSIPEVTSLAVSALNEQKPMWQVIQIFESPEPDSNPWAYRYPSEKQLRAMSYSAIIHGATGLTYFIWDSFISRNGNVLGVRDNPVAEGYASIFQAQMTSEQVAQADALWDALTDLNAETQSLSPVIFQPTVSPEDLGYGVTWANLSEPDDPNVFSSTPIRTLLKPDPDQQGAYVLMTVNLDDRSMDTTFDFTRELGSVQLLYDTDDGSLAAASGTNQINYHFDPYDVFVFHFTLAPLDPGDINGDGVVDSTDIDDLYDLIATGSGNSSHDLDGDGAVNSDDAVYLVEQIIGTRMGDANLDGVVDEADLAYLADGWKLGLGQDLYRWATGDFTGNGYISESDLAYLADNWKLAPPATAIPEPVTLLTLLTPFAVALRRRRRAG